MKKEDLIAFALPEKPISEIMVLGVGGAGGNAVNYMHSMGIDNVVFAICNTDKQALGHSKIPFKIQLGEGLGAGNNPDKAKQAAMESLPGITTILQREGTKMLFLAAGMGGGTGTGASAVIAKAAKAMDILTVGIVSLPLADEGPKRVRQAQKGLEELQEQVDSLVIVHNDNITKIYGDLPFEDAFAKTDEILALAAKSIAELVTRHDRINVDLEDVRTVMLNSGLALMGSARARGEGRIEELVRQTLRSPLLNYKDIRGAKKLLYNVSYGKNSGYTMSDHTQLLNLIQRNASSNVDRSYSDIIWGAGSRDDLDDQIELTVIATGFGYTEPVAEPLVENQAPKPEPGPDPNPDPASDPQPDPQQQPTGEVSGPAHESFISSLIRKGKQYIEEMMDSTDQPI